MIRNEVVSIDVGGSLIYPESVRITAGVGKGYNTCVIAGVDLLGDVNDEVTVSMNGDIYTFILDKKDYGKANKVTFNCKGLPSKLEDLIPSDEDFTYTSSVDLINDSVSLVTPNVDVNIGLPTISFTAQSYSKVSTPMSRIMDMVEIVKGEAWEQNGTLYLAEQKVIDVTPTVAHTFSEDEIVDYNYSENRESYLKVKQILINPISEDIYGIPSATLDYNEDEFSGEVFFNPSLTVGYGYGINGLGVRDAVRSVKTEKLTVDSDSQITVMGGIDILVNITLDGEPILVADYELYAGWNVVRFLSEKTGEIEITYYTKSVKVFAFRTTNFQITYQCTMIEGTIEVDADNVTNSGHCYTEIVEPFTYEHGGTVLVTSGQDVKFLFVEYKGATDLVQETTELLTGGGNLTVSYLHGGTDWLEKTFMNNITSAVKSTIETDNKEILFDDELGVYLVFLDKPITSINAIYFGSAIISGYTYVGTGDVPYITFNAVDVGKAVDISMTIDLVEITIPAPTEPHPATLFDVISCGGVATAKIVLADDALCNLPATFKVDVSGAFNVPIEDCFGLTVTGDLGNLVVDNFGKVEVTITSQGIFIIDCSSVKDDGKITIDSQGVV